MATYPAPDQYTPVFNQASYKTLDTLSTTKFLRKSGGETVASIETFNGGIKTDNVNDVAGNSLLTKTGLGSNVKSSSLTSLGTLSSLTVTGDVTVDSGTLKVDTTNNRVGIATASPIYPLHITGDCNIFSGNYRIGTNIVLSSNTLGSGVTASSLTSLGTQTNGVNVSTGQAYKINSVDVLSGTTLGAGVTSSSLTTVGTLASVAVAGGTDSLSGSGTLVKVARTSRNTDPIATFVAASNTTAGDSTSIAFGINSSARNNGVLKYTTGSDSNGNSVFVGFGTSGGGIHINNYGDRAGIRNTNPQYTLDVGGNCNVSSGSSYKVNGTDVLTGSTLGGGVTASSLTSLGQLSSLTVSGDVTIDSTTLKVDSANNYVGIKTASPGYPLHVTGDCNLTSGVYRIGNSTVISGSALGGGITSSALTSVGTLSSLNVSGTFQCAGWSAGNTFLEMANATDQVYIDFHSKSSGASDYDARISSSGGSGTATTGQGDLTITAKSVTMGTASASVSQILKGETQVYYSTYTDPYSGTPQALKVSGGLATDKLRVSNKGPFQIDYGTNAGGSGNGNQAFSFTFTNIPTVVCTLVSATTSTVFSVVVNGTNTTSFNYIKCYIATHAGAGGATNDAFNWIAIG